MDGSSGRIKMKIYDISMMLNDNTFVYKNKPEKKPRFIGNQNNDVYETTMTFNLHTGTHFDAPRHMIKTGKTIGEYELNRFITPAQVLDFTDLTDKITAEHLKGKNIESGKFILFKTINSFRDYFDPGFVYLEQTGADHLRKLKIAGIGIDALGIERNQPHHDTHNILLKNNIIILEGLRLKDVPTGNYLLIALPLKLNEAEAAPTRAVLIKEAE